MIPTKRILQVILFLSIILVSQISFGQTGNTKDSTNAHIQELKKEIKKDAEKIKQLTEAVQDIKNQNAVLDNSLGTLKDVLYIFGAIITIIMDFHGKKLTLNSSSR